MGNKNRTLRSVAATLWLLLGVAFEAEAQPAQDVFKQGLDAARSGYTLTALRYFQQAREAGYEGGALFYNLGVTHYKLGQYPESRAAFERLTAHPTLAALAYYNLGLVALRTDDSEQALAAFTEARDRASDRKLRALASTRIEELKSAEAAPVRRWTGAVSLGGGRDDVLLDPAEQVATENADEFAELFALGTGVIAGAPGNGWRADLSAYSARYQTFDEFDMNIVSAALMRVFPAGDWRLEVGAGGEQSTLGGDAYLREGQFRLTARLPEGAGAAGYRLRYRFHAIQSLDDVFDPQEGSRHDVDLEARWGGQAGGLAVIYGLEVNDREDFSADGLFTSYSPTRHRLALRADIDRGRWHWTGEIEYRLSDYDGTNVLADGSRFEREDERLRAAAGVDYRLSRIWQVNAHYSRIENDSNMAEYDYDQNLVTMGVTALF